MKYVLRNHTIYENFLAKLREVIDYDRPWVIDIKRYKNPRTIKQNNTMWFFHEQFVSWMFIHRNVEMTTQQWHYKIFCGHFTGYHEDQFIVLPNGDKQPTARGSSEISVTEFIDALDQYEAYKIEVTGVGFERREQDKF